MRQMAIGAAVLAASVALTATASAQQQRKYEAWKDPNAPEVQPYETPDHTKKLMQELRNLLAAGRRDRAAAPGFLDDLEDALDRHRVADRKLTTTSKSVANSSSPPPKAEPPRLANVFDDFSDGDFTRNPEWTLVRGEFFVARGARLFSFVQPQQAQQQQQSNQPRNDTEAVVRLFGTLLGGNRQQQQQQQEQRASAEPAAIFLPTEITNAFDMQTELMSDERTGGIFELGVYQGREGKNGYRLQFSGEGKARLIRVGRSVVVLREADFDFPRLQNRRPGTYKVRWIRDGRGQIQVRIDGRTVMTARDNGFRDDWDGFRLVNAEGRHGMDSLSIRMAN